MFDGDELYTKVVVLDEIYSSIFQMFSICDRLDVQICITGFYKYPNMHYCYRMYIHKCVV